MSASSGDREPISAEARMMAAEVRSRAADMPSAADISDIASEAMRTPGREMTPEEVRHLAREALGQAERLSWLLGKLAGLLEHDTAVPEGP